MGAATDVPARDAHFRLSDAYLDSYENSTAVHRQDPVHEAERGCPAEADYWWRTEAASRGGLAERQAPSPVHGLIRWANDTAKRPHPRRKVRQPRR